MGLRRAPNEFWTRASVRTPMRREARPTRCSRVNRREAHLRPPRRQMSLDTCHRPAFQLFQTFRASVFVCPSRRSAKSARRRQHHRQAAQREISWDHASCARLRSCKDRRRCRAAGCASQSDLRGAYLSRLGRCLPGEQALRLLIALSSFLRGLHRRFARFRHQCTRRATDIHRIRRRRRAGAQSCRRRSGRAVGRCRRRRRRTRVRCDGRSRCRHSALTNCLNGHLNLLIEKHWTAFCLSAPAFEALAVYLLNFQGS
jgi:hypothetical protein